MSERGKQTGILQLTFSGKDKNLIETLHVLAVTDPSIVGALAGIALIVGLFGLNTVKN